MKFNKKNIIIVISITILAAFWVGCNSAAGLLGNVSSETESEKIIPAEFKIAETEGKIAVLIQQPGWIKTPMDLRIPLTKYINTSLKETVKLKEDRLIEYKDVLNARLQLPDDKRDEPNEIAAKLGAKYVLYVQIMDFDLSTFAERDFYNGLMKTNASLLDEKGNRIWPKDESKASIVEIEDEKGTIEASVNKLTAATAHCITRYFYDCKTIRFRVPEEHKEIENYDF
ncbi:MAG: hypothetical protein A2Y12_11270 [Planctomycetes bacterium GWF2_42_9]|nr:MAG: hypothetical protein A2Y12_11270 [Planctomycetes bacterium GWF2_42_9]